MRFLCCAAPAFLIALLGGCQRAKRYGPRPSVETPRRVEDVSENPPAADHPQPLDSEIQWMDVLDSPKPDVPIVFVHAEKAPEEWAKLPVFWNAPALTKPDRAAALVGLPPLAAGAAVTGSSASLIKIKVPLGLPDPREYVPASNPLTLGKWELGRRLFFDDAWLAAKRGTSCAGCHRPDHGFADSERFHPDSFNTPTLINCVFNSSQFWDGRAGRLEEVVQRSLDDEREANPPRPFRHTWPGVIHRLRDRVDYRERFNEVFGRPPDGPGGKARANITQDTVGRALAAYLRTILAGDSIYDRALRERDRKHSPTLQAEHFEAVLDEAARKELGRDSAAKANVAAELMRGCRLFFNLEGGRPMSCSRCHDGRNFTDNGFHNLGVGDSSRPGQEGGHFAVVPVGQKDRYLIDAYKTPTLRNLPRTGPYFHNGMGKSLREVVEFYSLGTAGNNHLDPILLGKDGQARVLDLNDAEIDALVLFLTALAGREVDTILKTPP